MPGLEPELAADELVLRGLRVLQRRRPAIDHDRARVGHRGPEHDPVEVVRDVVVVRDRGGVAFLRVAPAVQAGLLGRRRERPQSRPAPASRSRALEPLLRAELYVGEVVAEREHREDVALDVELAGHVRATKPELAGRGDEPSEHGGGADQERGGRVGATEPAPVVRAHRDREVGAEDGLECTSHRHRSRVTAGRRSRWTARGLGGGPRSAPTPRRPPPR